MMVWVLSMMLTMMAMANDAVVIEAWVSNAPESGVGTLVVQMDIPNGFDVQWPEPKVDGLRFTELATHRLNDLVRHLWCVVPSDFQVLRDIMRFRR